MSFFIYKVKNFKEHQKNIIDLIYRIPLNPKIDKNGGEKISHTDWNLTDEVRKEYRDYIHEHILKDFSANFIKSLKTHSLGINRLWFQVYRKNDFHGYHTHPDTNFANILYVKLPNKNVITKFKIPNNEDVNLNVSEGDIVTFPAFYIHQSPINTNDEEKIVVSFNSNSFFNTKTDYHN
tara:strand:+ start:2537 stop:3073 length:537 start_codon:yes stop_codon:yes gene_type:complete